MKEKKPRPPNRREVERIESYCYPLEEIALIPGYALWINKFKRLAGRLEKQLEKKPKSGIRQELIRPLVDLVALFKGEEPKHSPYTRRTNMAEQALIYLDKRYPSVMSAIGKYDTDCIKQMMQAIEG
jgi:hypothetical protein